MANNIKKIRVLVVGDSGVGKTCLTHLIAHGESLYRPGWTVGCNIEVKLHEYGNCPGGNQQIYFVELFDIGGSLSHKNTRSVFYQLIDGIIMVHDLTNRRSEENLRDWLYEILNKEGKDTYKGTSTPSSGSNPATPTTTFTSYPEVGRFDVEQFLGEIQVPILIIGTKLDLIEDLRQPQALKKSGGVAEQCGAEEIWLNCRNQRSFSPGSTDSVKLSRFIDKIIDKKSRSRDSGAYEPTDNRRKYTSPHQPTTIR